jgi:membrane-associated phospholipid phosphatase
MVQEPSTKLLSKLLLRSLARSASICLHPALMPTLAYFIAYFFIYQASFFQVEYWQKLGLIFLGTFLMPALSILSLWRGGLISTLDVRKRRERPLLFVIGCVFYSLTAYFMLRIEMDLRLVAIMLGISFSVIALTLTTLFFKISAHAIGLSGVLGVVTAFQVQFPLLNLIYWISFLLFLLGLVMTSRLYLQAHRPIEVWLGALLGFSLCFGSVYWAAF